AKGRRGRCDVRRRVACALGGLARPYFGTRRCEGRAPGCEESYVIVGPALASRSPTRARAASFGGACDTPWRRLHLACACPRSARLARAYGRVRRASERLRACRTARRGAARVAVVGQARDLERPRRVVRPKRRQTTLDPDPLRPSGRR